MGPTVEILMFEVGAGSEMASCSWKSCSLHDPEDPLPQTTGDVYTTPSHSICCFSAPGVTRERCGAALCTQILLQGISTGLRQPQCPGQGC